MIFVLARENAIVDAEEREHQISIDALQNMDKILSEREDDIRRSIRDNDNIDQAVSENKSDQGSHSEGESDDDSPDEDKGINSDKAISERNESAHTNGGRYDAQEKLDIKPSASKNKTSNSVAEEVKEVSEEEEEEEEILCSCEISFFVRVDNKIKSRHDGLADLCSNDVAVYISQQLKQKRSGLLKGIVSRNIVDVRIKANAFSPRYFTRWEQRWVYIISPVYFGHSTKKSERKRLKQNGEDRLPGGLQVVNPVSRFTEDEKNTFLALGGGKLPTKKKVGSEEEAADAGPLVDLDVDDIAAELGIGGSTGPKIYRPNMSKLNEREVEKCKRIYKAFLEVYETQMRRGLIDGKRLRREQYDALKDRDAAKRIYDIAKQKLHRDQRLAEDDSAFKPHITKITDEVFNEWKKELEDDEKQLLLEKKKNVSEARENRRKMANMKKLYERQRVWMVAKLISLSGVVKTIAPFGPAFEEELELQVKDLAKIHNPEANAVEVLKIKTQKASHEKLQKMEAKLTKQLFANISIWVCKNIALKEFRETEINIGSESNTKLATQQDTLQDDSISVVSLGSVEQGWEQEQQQNQDQRRQSIPSRKVSFAEIDTDQFENIRAEDELNNISVQSKADSDNVRCPVVLGPNGEVLSSECDSQRKDEMISSSAERHDCDSESRSCLQSSGNGKSGSSNDASTVSVDDETKLNTRRNSSTGEGGMPNSARRRSISTEGVASYAVCNSEDQSVFTAAIEYPDEKNILKKTTHEKSSVGSAPKKRRLSVVSSSEANTSRKGSIQMNTGTFLGLGSVSLCDSSPSIDLESLSLAADASFISRKDVFAYFNRVREVIAFGKKTHGQEKRGVDEGVMDQRVPFRQSVAQVSAAGSPMLADTGDDDKEAPGKNEVIKLEADLDGNATLSTEELELVKKLKWVEIVCCQSEFRSCMQTIPTEGKTDFTRDEFLLIARLVNDLEGAFSRAKAATIKLSTTDKKELKKEVEERLRAPAKNKKKSKHEELIEKLSSGDPSLLVTASSSTKALSREEGLRRESIRRASNFTLAAARRNMREKAWLTAHQHLFIKLPAKPKYCVICAEKSHDGWVADHDKAEKAWAMSPDGKQIICSLFFRTVQDCTW